MQAIIVIAIKIRLIEQPGLHVSGLSGYEKGNCTPLQLQESDYCYVSKYLGWLAGLQCY